MDNKIDLKSSLINKDSQIIDALEAINKGGGLIGLIVENEILIGVITDGDIRRALLKGYKLSDSIRSFYKQNFAKIYDFQEKNIAKRIMKEKEINSLPVINEKGIPVDILTFSSFSFKKVVSNPVLIMCGGKGKRLRPMTLDCPKPMLLLDNNKPILQVIVERLSNYGLKNLFFSVNYKKEKIIDYFNDGRDFGVNIEYLTENEPLGTGGSLYLLPKSIQESIIVMNGDVITGLNFLDLLVFHDQIGSEATMCVRELGINVQFGVINCEGTKFREIEEKPIINKMINAGIYVLKPSLIRKLLPFKRKIDITDLFQEASENNNNINVFPLHEYWIDIGLPDSFERAKQEYRDMI